MNSGNKLKSSVLRIPEDLRLYLKHQALDNHRSMNGEILFRLEESRRSDKGAGAREAKQCNQ